MCTLNPWSFSLSLFLFFNLLSGSLFTHSSESKIFSLAQYILIITNELLIQTAVCGDFHSSGIFWVTDRAERHQRLTLRLDNMDADVSAKMAAFKVFALQALLFVNLKLIHIYIP